MSIQDNVGSREIARPNYMTMDSTPSSSVDVISISNLKADDSKPAKFGYLGCTPSWLQFLHKSKFLLWCICWCSIVQGFIVNGHIPVIISTLQLRFNFSSTQMGLLAVMYDIAVLICLIPLGHFGGKGHKGRWLGCGMMIMAVGAFLQLLPQFLTGDYKADNDINNKTCTIDGTNMCDLQSSKEDATAADQLRNWLYLFLFGNFLVGVGGSPLWTLGITYLDENVSQRSSPLYLAIYNASGAIGPALGFVLGGSLLKIYGDPGVDWKALFPNGSADSRWYGAWWIGYIIALFIAILSGLPMLAFARQLPEAKKHRAKDTDHSNKQGETGNERLLTTDLKDLPLHALSLGRNITYVALILAQTSEVFVTNGTVTFLPKLLENVFNMSTAQAGMIVGAIMVPGAIIGQVAGGVFLRQLPVGVRPMLLAAALFMSIAFSLCFTFLIRCPEAPIAGVNTAFFETEILEDVSFSTLSTIDECNRNCGCDEMRYDPVCDRTSRVSYVHPCKAGCASKIKDPLTNEVIYTECQCAGNSSSSTPDLSAILAPGVCQMDCGNKLYIFLAVVFVYVVCKFIAFQPIQQAQLRCVRFEQRTIALSLSWIIMRLLGTIPGGILFGKGVDMTCVHARLDCNNQQLACLRYDADKMSKVFLAFTATGKCITITLLLVGAFFYRSGVKPTPSEHPIVHNGTSSPSTASTVNTTNQTPPSDDVKF